MLLLGALARATPQGRRPVWMGLASLASACVLGTLTTSASPFIGFAAVFALLAVVLVMLVPNAWMIVVVVLLPFSDYFADKIALPYLVGTPARLVLAVICLAGVGYYLTSRMRPAPPAVQFDARRTGHALIATTALFGLFLGWSAFTRSPNRMEVFAFGLDVFVLPVLAFWSLSSCLPRAKQVRPVILAATASLALQVVMGLYEYITHDGLATISTLTGPRVSFGLTNAIIGVRADGSFLRSEDYALFCGAVAYLLMAYWLARSQWRIAFVISALGTAGCFFSGLRGILIPFIVISTVIFLRFFGRAWRSLFVITSVVFVASVFLFPMIDLNSYGVYRERLKNTESIYIRVASYATAVAVFQDHWVSGVGFGNYAPEATRSEYVRFHKGSASVPFTHNSFLAFLADGGVIGGALYIALFWAVIKRNIEGGPYALSAGIPIIVLFLATGLSLNVAYEAVPVAIAMVLAGMTHVLDVGRPVLQHAAYRPKTALQTLP